jgi:hypothetical protein
VKRSRSLKQFTLTTARASAAVSDDFFFDGGSAIMGPYAAEALTVDLAFEPALSRAGRQLLRMEKDGDGQAALCDPNMSSGAQVLLPT